MSSQLGNSHEFIAFLEEDLMLSDLEAPPSTAMDVSMLKAGSDISMSFADVTMLTVMDADFDDLPFPSQIPVTDGEAEEVDEFDGFEEADLLEQDLMEEECDELFEFELDMSLTQATLAIEPSDPVEHQEFTGFTTGKGRALPPPSEESIKRAKRLVEEVEVEGPVAEEVSIVVGFSTGKGKALPPPSKEALERAQALISADNDNNTSVAATSSFGGFSTGKGKALPPPSKEALERAQSLIGSEIDSAPSAPAAFGGFSTGKGKAMPPPSKEALERAQALIGSEPEPTVVPSFSTGKGKAVPPPSKEALQRAQSLVNSSNENLPPKQPTSMAQSSLQPKRRAWKQPRQILAKPPTEVTKKTPPVSLFELKSTQSRLKLAQYFIPSLPSAHSMEVYSQFVISQNVLEMNSIKAAAFKWPLFGPEEARIALIDAGAQASCCPLEWIENHWRWIVWKFASLIRAFPFKYSADNLSPSWILSQLTYRYEREVNAAQRSALKRCLERDDSPSKYLCLAVAQIDRARGCLELTDGWYSCWTTAFDAPLRELMTRDRLFCGQKLEICGAQLTGEDGILALEGSRPDCPVKLIISRNSIRRARWDCKLGFQFQAPAFLKHLSQVHPQGGYLPAIKVLILRCYPLAFRDDAKGTVRSEREHFEFLERNLPTVTSKEADPPSFSPIQKIRAVDPLRPEVQCVITFWCAIESLPQEGSLATFTALKTPLKTKRLSWPNEEASPILLSATKSTRILPEASTAKSTIEPTPLSKISSKGDYDLSGLFLGKNNSLLWFCPTGDDQESEDSLFCIKLPQLLTHLSFSVGERVWWRDAHFLNHDARAGVFMFDFTERTDFRKDRLKVAIDAKFEKFDQKYRGLIK